MSAQTTVTPESNVSQNGTAQTQTEQLSGTIGRLLQADTPFLVWLIFFSVGGGILALYYARIGYLPEMEWKAALVYLFICSMVGGVIGLLLTMSLYLPGIIWADVIVFDKFMDGELTYEVEHMDHAGNTSKRKEPCIRTIITYLGAPYMGVLLISHLSLPFAIKTGWSSMKIIELYWLVAGVLLVVMFFGMREIFRYLTDWKKLDNDVKVATEAKKEEAKKKRDTVDRQIVKYSSWFTLSILLNQISMYLIYRLSGRTPDLFDFLTLTVICTAAVGIATHAVAASHRSYPAQAVIASLVTAGLLLVTADNFSSLSMNLLSHYGIGESQKFNFLVKGDGLKIISDQKLRCEESGQYLCDVEILSKMGDHYFLRVGSNSGKKNITLPKTDVVFMIRVDQPKVH